MKVFAAYAAALVVGLATALLALRLGRTTPLDTHVSFAAAIVGGLAIVAALLAAALPRHWLGVALALALPSSILGIVTFVLVARLGEFYWTWLGAALAILAASLLAARLSAWARRA